MSVSPLQAEDNRRFARPTAVSTDFLF